MSRAIPFSLFLSVGLLAVAASPARAQSYDISWYTIDGGGGTSSGGQYTVSGTIGQPDAGHMSGGNFTLDGGFWSFLSVVQTPGAPLLTIQLLNGTNAVISWPASATGFNLQQNTDANVPAGWATNGLPAAVVVNGTNTVTVPANLSRRFFRLKQ